MKIRHDFEIKCGSSFGANMGRPNRNNGCLEGKVRLVRVPINSGGYDPGGAYWGIGKPLYCASGSNGGLKYFRAHNRNDAKQQLQDSHHSEEGIRFYR